LGLGFARLAGAEGLRRSPGRVRFVEDALLELLRNSRDAGARNIYVASTLKARRYRTLTVIDDGCGVPETHKRLIFEPGVTTRHLDPIPYLNRNDDVLFHGAGLSLYHIKSAALSAEILSAASPTVIRVIFDTDTLPEKSLQSGSRPSKTNLRATLAKFVGQTAPNPPRLYYASPAQILATLLAHRILHRDEETKRLGEAARDIGLEVSPRTVQRVVAGAVSVADEVVADGDTVVKGRARRRNGTEGPILSVGDEDLREIFAVLRRAARSSYLDIAGLDVEKLPGEVLLRAHIYEPEEEYE
jgi:hypothetical protein